MNRLLKVHDRVFIIKGEHAGSVGWIQRIEVEPTTDVKALVLLTIELSKPYGQTIEALPSMITFDEEIPFFTQPQLAA
jgi:ribosomal protein S4E